MLGGLLGGGLLLRRFFLRLAGFLSGGFSLARADEALGTETNQVFSVRKLQRFMHKLVYYPANNDGKFGCVGCGRCLVKCPISMNIVKVMKCLGEADRE